MSSIFLTSTGLSDEKIRQEFMRRIGTDRTQRVAIVTTAASGKADNKYAKLAEAQFKKLGFSAVDFIDIEFDSPKILNKYHIIYVCGGNTFYILYHLKKSGADKVLSKLLKKSDIIYIGVSAGSIVLAPTIRLAATVDPDPNDIGLTDFTGLGVIDFEIHPHYDPEQESEIINYEKNSNHKVIRLSNSQAFVLSDSKQKLIG